MQLVIDGIPVEVNRKKIKNMYLYVKPPEGAVSVSAPLRMPRQNIERFVREKRGWIEIRRDSFRPQYEERKDGAETGEEHTPQIRPLDTQDREALRELISCLLPTGEERTGLLCS